MRNISIDPKSVWELNRNISRIYDWRFFASSSYAIYNCRHSQALTGTSRTRGIVSECNCEFQIRTHGHAGGEDGGEDTIEDRYTLASGSWLGPYWLCSSDSSCATSQLNSTIAACRLTRCKTLGITLIRKSPSPVAVFMQILKLNFAQEPKPVLFLDQQSHGCLFSTLESKDIAVLRSRVPLQRREINIAFIYKDEYDARETCWKNYKDASR